MKFQFETTASGEKGVAINRNNLYPPYGRRSAAKEGFKKGLLVMFACVLKADGVPKKSQLDVVKRFLVSNLEEQEALESLVTLKTLLGKRINVAEISRQTGQNMNYESRLELLRLLFAIAYADGLASNKKYVLLAQISSIFHISNADFGSIKIPSAKTGTDNYQWAYEILEIEITATNSEIKKAYRKLVLKYHPDKLNSADEDLKKENTEKFRSIKKAYDTLKKQRGFS
ncbi:DnaJ domain-containing protein [Paludibacteraceae bacterium OttesenSCG-928-F17]|nr:DnaJ domain-containing protein [Paludibacteraceae bacterium OttesenSCG-928-F17]